MQETLLRAWLHPDAIAERPARPWLFAVARNLAVDAHRARQARPREVGEAALELMPVAGRGRPGAGVLGGRRRAAGRCGPSTGRVLLETYYRGRSVAEAAVSARRSGRHREVADLLRAQGAEAGTRGTGACAMSDPACRTFRQLLGVYVVGAIEPAERTLVDAHLNDAASAARNWPACAAARPAGPGAGRGRRADHPGQRGLRDLEEPSAELLDPLLKAGRRAARHQALAGHPGRRGGRALRDRRRGRRARTPDPGRPWPAPHHRGTRWPRRPTRAPAWRDRPLRPDHLGHRRCRCR